MQASPICRRIGLLALLINGIMAAKYTAVFRYSQSLISSGDVKLPV